MSSFGPYIRDDRMAYLYTQSSRDVRPDQALKKDAFSTFANNRR